MSKLLALGLALIGLAIFFRRGWLHRMRQQRLDQETAQRAADKILNACRFAGIVPIELNGQPAWIDWEQQRIWRNGAGAPDEAAQQDFQARLGELAQESHCDFIEVDGSAESRWTFRLDYPQDIGALGWAALPPDMDSVVFQPHASTVHGTIPPDLVRSPIPLSTLSD